MSTLGHKQTSASGLGMSAYPHLADMLDAECHKRTSIRALNFVMMTRGEVFSRTRASGAVGGLSSSSREIRRGVGRPAAHHWCYAGIRVSRGFGARNALSLSYCIITALDF